ncbi:carboxylesterase/lipase family protein [Actinomadura sp. NTSP31]|uniref:carboxylesterase/lipase family protein n=1 Tax=Actinomadura sp. NTSP31 TaxID=1735447 RepID=UPI0035C2221A
MRLKGVAIPMSALVVAGGLVPAPASAAPSTPAVVRTDTGLVRGEVRQDDRLFQGVPFAQPPTGALRWRPPQPARPWSGTYDATFPRSQCAQIAPVYGGETTYAEDCLYLNVTTPNRAPKGRHALPVMVWAHGGSNLTGTGSAYNASKLAVRGGVIVVTVNYRLGPLGWLAHPALETGADRRYQAGNYGLLDQQAALRWVRRNIAAFGGDPRNVTLFGESAGAADSCANLVSPSAAGLFDKVIPESLSCAAPARTEAGAEADGAGLADAVGCAGKASPAETAACLRAVPVRTLLESFQAKNMTAGPVAGGDRVLPLQPAQAIAQGRFNRVSVMHGNTLDEMRLFVSLSYPQPITAAQYEGIVHSMYGADADKVLARYPARNYPDPRIALSTIETDFGTSLSTCLHQDAFQALSRAGVPVYAYQFADRTAPPLVDVPGFDEGAEHATELTYLFPGLLGDLNAQQRQLSDAMVDYWTSFARTAHPTAANAPHWPRFRSPSDVLSFAPGPNGIHPTDTAVQSNCAFWKSLSS